MHRDGDRIIFDTPQERAAMERAEVPVVAAEALVNRNSIRIDNLSLRLDSFASGSHRIPSAGWNNAESRRNDLCMYNAKLMELCAPEIVAKLTSDIEAGPATQ